jgi:hypothetical protein
MLEAVLAMLQGIEKIRTDEPLAKFKVECEWR